MSHIWLERYGSLFSEEINFAPIRHSWKKWGLKHRRVFGSEAADNLYPFRPNPLPSTPTQSQPNSIPFLSPIQVWIEAQVRPTWPKEHQTLSFFFFLLFFPPLAVSSYCFSAIPRLHQLLFRATPFPHANVTAAPAFFLPPASYHLLSCCMFVPHAAHAANLKISFPTQEQTPPAGHDAHAYLQQLPVTWRPPGLALKANEKEEWRGWPFWLTEKGGCGFF